jgi:hypothetical protein
MKNAIKKSRTLEYLMFGFFLIALQQFTQMVPRAGLEPAHPKARDFKSLVSTDFTIWADGFFLQLYQ